ncbi:NAD(P)-dependent dehydrogenase (short-subunit alcohol dehydrogenase family) [Erwinia toletana]|uniref:NAD(P)-dependent dehydrogenase (Short-subunit alcohol dehydrogenase family) n=1 Tax=Winslowiella toletana TaxID=92490 RepID=A0ABS4PFH9_9GAMM|nr:SDR family oxidoreductase [Winslowiella toletana]MBP2171406.1 NAD(P)-dependent dehydrogenase (short-subunit alcohol dehydrogenase family) [Winslowiella toletana]
MSVIVITGGSRGIGASAAIQIASRGMGVILTYNSHPEEAEAVVSKINAAGGKAVALALNVSNVASFAGFATDVAAALATHWDSDRIHGLVNNAGFGNFAAIEALTEAEFDGLLNVHLKGPFFLTQALLPLIADGGQIINMTSATTRVATPGAAPYAAFKGGLEVLTRYMAQEFGPRRIRANSISPGAIRTDMTNGAFDQSPEFVELLSSQTALGRIGEPDDVGRVIASLLSADNGWVNAQNIEVGGGYII